MHFVKLFSHFFYQELRCANFYDPNITIYNNWIKYYYYYTNKNIRFHQILDTIDIFLSISSSFNSFKLPILFGITIFIRARPWLILVIIAEMTVVPYQAAIIKDSSMSGTH